MEREEVIERFSAFLTEFYYTALLKASDEGAKSVDVDFRQLEQFDAELADWFIDAPDQTLSFFQEALSNLDVPDAKIKMRFFNLPASREIRIRNVRAEHVKRLIVIDGMVRRASEIRPEVSEAIFECMECGSRVSMLQTDASAITYPFECENPNCGSKKRFKFVDHKIFDARWLTVEEPYEVVSSERPSQLKIYLKEDLTSPKFHSKTDPGNRIKMVGVLKELPKRIKGAMSRQMDIYLEANSIQNLENIEWEELDIKPEDEKCILELSRDPKVYDKLTASVAPSIYGMDEIKQSVILQLFGGCQHIQKDKSKIRGDINILLVGDPSTAKSALLKVVSTLIPRGRYVSGKGVTGAGLTATVVKDEDFLGGWVLEAGAVVMSNRSLCCIDEFEKIEKTDQVALHEAMEQNTVSIAKASIIATLPAQTAILAGANPKLGRFDDYMPIKEQLNIPETILSRFDLKFALRDIPDMEKDAKMAEHILQSRHYGEVEIKAEVEATLLKKYVAYARKHCHPKLTHEAGEELKRFFLELREKSKEGPISITTRQYEALIRMAEASAKIQLRGEVNKEDAIRAISLMKFSLRQFGMEPGSDVIDIDKVEGQTMTASQRNKSRLVLEIIDELTALMGKDIPKEEVVKRAERQGLNSRDVEEMIEKMKREGLLFSSKHGVIAKA